MSTNKIFKLIDEVLPNGKIIKDLRSTLWEGDKDKTIEVELENDFCSIPSTVKIEILSKGIFQDYIDVSFGTYRVLLSIGKISDGTHGILSSEYCFATLYYNQDCQLITLDLHQSLYRNQ